MTFTQFLSIIDSKKDSIDQLKKLVDGLENEIRYVEQNVRAEHREVFKDAIRERYARMANRVIQDLFFVPDDFKSDPEL